MEQLFDIAGKDSDRWIVYEGDEQIFIGWGVQLRDSLIHTKSQSELWERIKDKEVQRFNFTLDIKHREWKERGLMPPIMPDELPQYEFKDLRTELYYVAHI